MLRLKTRSTSVGNPYPMASATIPSLTDTNPSHPGTLKCHTNCAFAVSRVYLSFQGSVLKVILSRWAQSSRCSALNVSIRSAIVPASFAGQLYPTPVQGEGLPRTVQKEASRGQQRFVRAVCHRFSGCYSSFLLSNSSAASLMILISSSSLISETSPGAAWEPARSPGCADCPSGIWASGVVVTSSDAPRESPPSTFTVSPVSSPSAKATTSS